MTRTRSAFVALLLLPVVVSATLIAQDKDASPDKPAAEKPPAEKQAAEKQSTEKTDGKSAAAKKTEEPEQLPIAQDPYGVLVNLTVPMHPRFDAAAREQLRVAVVHAVERTWGGMWDADVRMNDWICIGESIERMEPQTVSDIVGRQYDKVMFVALDPDSLALTVREWDYRSNSMTVPAFGESFELAAVPNDIVRMMVEVFQPVLLWRRTDKFDKSYIEVTLKAGAFPAPDPIAEQIRPGDVLTPVVRYFNRRERDVVEKIQPQPLTYLVVQDIDGDVIGGTVVSGVPTVFGKSARRAEQFALRQRPRHKSTRIRMVLRNNPDKPLLCHRVNVVQKLKYRDQELEPPVDLISDRFGKVDIPVGSYPTCWIYVYSGKLLLARIPYAPGLVAEETVQMPDDSMRLLVEGEVDLLKGRLIDLVARRAVHMSAAMQYSKDGKVEEAKAELAALEALPGLKEFQDQITTFRRPAVLKAEAARNRVSRGRILKVCREIENVLNTYFDPEKEKAFRDRLDEVFGDNVPEEDENQ